MDSKIILAILIVALIGIVAATYQNETSDAIETLSNVATEDEVSDSVTDILDNGVDANSESLSNIIEEDVVKPDNGISTKSNNKNQINTVKQNKISNNNQKTPNNVVNKNQTIINNNTTNPSVKISAVEAKKIATDNLPEEYSKAVASTPTLNNKYYEVNFYLDEEVIGYYEIDANTGKITGGAFKGEVPEP